MRSLVGSFKILIALFVTVGLVTPAAHAAVRAPSPVPRPPQSVDAWSTYSKLIEKKKEDDRRRGLSYIISGSVGLAGGLAGTLVAKDEIEKGIYSVFETIGVASIGYGSYTWLVGDEERAFYSLLSESTLSTQEKSNLVELHTRQKKDREKRERLVKAITHGLITGLNIYSAQQQQNQTLKTGMYFIAGVNLLACVSYTFEF